MQLLHSLPRRNRQLLQLGNLIEKTDVEISPWIQMVDLAKLAGVSKSTVSRALANSPLIPAETKENIVALTRRANTDLF